MTERDREFKPESYEACQGCPLLPKGKDKPRFVPTERGEKAPQHGPVDVVFVGEAPGEEEAAEKRPFVGVSGQKLRKAIQRTVETQSYAFTNVVRCRPTDDQGKNRAPTEKEIQHCKPYVDADIKALGPRLVVPLGGTALQAVTPPGLFTKEGAKPSIMKVRGQIREATKGRRYLAVYHPSYVLRNFKEEGVWEQDLAKVQVGLSSSEADTPFMNKGKSTHLATLEEVKTYLRWLRKECEDPVAVDIETENLHRVAPNRILSVQFAHDIGHAHVILLDHVKSPWTSEEREEIKAELKKTLTKAEKVKLWITHNGKFDYDKLSHMLGAVRWSAPIVDTMFMAHLLDDNRAGDNESGGGSVGYRLKNGGLAEEWLNYHHYDKESLGSRGKGGLAMESMPLKDFVKYGGEDAYVTLRLFRYILQAAEREGYKNKLLRMAVKWGARMLEMIPTMERWGFAIDRKQLALLSSKDSPVRKRVAELEREINNMEVVRKANSKLCEGDGRTSGMNALFGQQQTWLFDLGKKGHLETVCFNVLRLKPVNHGKPTDKWPKGAPAIDKTFFAEYAPDKGQEEGRETIPFVAALKEYRGLAKLESGYVQSIRAYLFDDEYNADNKDDGRIRASFWITRTVTGRWSSSDLNLQQAPRCCRGGTLVRTRGGIVSLAEMVNDRSIDVPEGARKVKDWHRYEVRKTIALTTERGYSLEGTPNHRVPVLTPDFRIVDKELSELTVGDFLLLSLGGRLPEKCASLPELPKVDTICQLCGKDLSRGSKSHFPRVHGMSVMEYRERTGHVMRDSSMRVPRRIPKVMDEKLARLVGHLLSEGYLARVGLDFWNADPKVMADFVTLWKEVFGEKARVVEEERNDGKHERMFMTSVGNSRVLRHWLDQWGVHYALANEKTVPSVILKSPRTVMLSFLAGFIAGDGHIRKDYVTMSSVSRKMLVQVQALLSALGYPSSLSCTYEAHGNKQSSYELKVHGEDARALEKELPFVRDAHKAAGEIRYKGLRHREIPFLKEYVKSSWPRVKPCTYNVGGEHVRIPYPGTGGTSLADSYSIVVLSRDHQGVLETLKAHDPERYALVQKFLHNETLAVKVVELKERNHKKPVAVYDLTTDTHYYNANGLVTHNSDNEAKAAIKSLYRAAPGCILLEADYGQAEIRWWAHISGDKAFIDSFRKMAVIEALALENPNDEVLAARVKNECDIHRQVAAAMFGIPVNDVTKDQRQAAKALAFGSIYGQHYKTLARILKKTPDEALEIQRKFLSNFPRAGTWLTTIQTEGQTNGYVESPMGRRRRLHAMYASGDEGMIQAANRRARNSPIQAQSSDTTGLAAWLMVRYIQKHNKSWKVINVVHDALTLEIPLVWEEIQEASRILHEIMTKTVMQVLKDDFGVTVEVPFSVDYKLGLKWGHMGKEARGAKLRKEYKRFKEEHKKEVESGWCMKAA